jgi:hypothetical protein
MMLAVGIAPLAALTVAVKPGASKAGSSGRITSCKATTSQSSDRSRRIAPLFLLIGPLAMAEAQAVLGQHAELGPGRPDGEGP